MGHRETTLADWLAWFGRDPRPKSVMFEGKLLILSDVIYFTLTARNVKIFEEVAWPSFVCARMIMDDYMR